MIFRLSHPKTHNFWDAAAKLTDFPTKNFFIKSKFTHNGIHKKMCTSYMMLGEF